MIKKKSLLNYCGLLGVAAFLSYTAAVVLLFIVSLVLIIIVGAKDKSCRSYGIFAATGYNAVLGIELYRMKF